MSAVKEKILILLFGGLALGFTYLPYKQWRIIKGIAKALTYHFQKIKIKRENWDGKWPSP